MRPVSSLVLQSQHSWFLGRGSMVIYLFIFLPFSPGVPLLNAEDLEKQNGRTVIQNPLGKPRGTLQI